MWMVENPKDRIHFGCFFKIRWWADRGGKFDNALKIP